MQTTFSLAQLADPAIAEADSILRKCVHCGFCTATCPTYLLLGDERDSPRGRIYLIKEMLEQGRPASTTVATHIDRCLSCLACMTTCPSSVHYMHLVDHARVHIEKTYRRPWADRALRALLAAVLPYRGRFRLAMAAGALLRPLRAALPGRLAALLAMARAPAPPSDIERPQVVPAQGERRRRVALLTGCVQTALSPEINAATVRLLTRLGCEVVIAEGVGCCGALAHHLGKEEQALAAARANVAAWQREIAQGGLDAIVVNASGCGTMLKDYAHLLQGDPAWAERAAAVAERARDVSEVVGELWRDDAARAPDGAPTVAYHAACSLQHGQRIVDQPRRLLERAGFRTVAIPEGHLCCGSAGTYNLLQPELAGRLRARKLANIARTGAAVVAAGNVGCLVQLDGPTPAVHTVELLDWASGGPPPAALAPSTAAAPRAQA